MSKREVHKNPNPRREVKTSTSSQTDIYSKFNELDGTHPWQDAVPDGFISYPVRNIGRGQVIYFNFQLAKEMGLIPAHHAHELSQSLQEKILETFAIQIINEFDQQNGLPVPSELIKPNNFMATRYLQLQHSNKQGKTSGDGRSIWNGSIRHAGRTWDVSSRGTGVTSLAPGAVEANRPLQTGATDFGYGCGMADVDELYGSALMSEIFHLQGVQTERVLTIIDLGKGVGIGVRAALNLIRPAHLFLHLKQGRYRSLKRATDYLIERQVANGRWHFNPASSDRYDLMLNEVCAGFARFAAQLERNYIFAWMDWDGDNVLADAGIIDYGSIRQFGLRHDQYRYDDVQRFSTNLNEQRIKARQTVRVFIQLVAFLKSRKRRPLNRFQNHPVLNKFDAIFERSCREFFLKQIGFTSKQITALLQRSPLQSESLYQTFLVLEKTKTKGKTRRLPDGVNRPAVFKMRAVLRELPNMLIKVDDFAHCEDLMADEDILDLMTSSFAKRYDTRLTPNLRGKIRNFVASYCTILRRAFGEKPNMTHLKDLNALAQMENKNGRITGNGAEFLIDAILKAKRRGMSPADIQKAVELYTDYQVPTVKTRTARLISLQSPIGQLFQNLLTLSIEFEDEI